MAHIDVWHNPFWLSAQHAIVYAISTETTLYRYAKCDSRIESTIRHPLVISEASLVNPNVDGIIKTKCWKLSIMPWQHSTLNFHYKQIFSNEWKIVVVRYVG